MVCVCTIFVSDDSAIFRCITIQNTAFRSEFARVDAKLMPISRFHSNGVHACLALPIGQNTIYWIVGVKMYACGTEHPFRVM